ncbi:5255_t:CDS:1, partial [Acaulospora morrowiae]
RKWMPKGTTNETLNECSRKLNKESIERTNEFEELTTTCERDWRQTSKKGSD